MTVAPAVAVDGRRVVALSLHRPWPSLVLRPDLPAWWKRVENRTWSPARAGLRPPFVLVVHGSRRWDPSAVVLAGRLGVPTRDEGGPDLSDEGSPAGYLGCVDVVGVCHAAAEEVQDALLPPDPCGCGPWAFPGSRHWALERPALFPAPLPGRGAQGFWSPPADVLGLVADTRTTDRPGGDT